MDQNSFQKSNIDNEKPRQPAVPEKIIRNYLRFKNFGDFDFL
jgi:hypothetical protein